mmetsp:Transcript_19269/g.35357  ORF Transcript_19269/g.35357 Transcript_19269/m.35357 type:complete len:179 (+) Transcript_19269:3304-3840(+)
MPPKKPNPKKGEEGEIPIEVRNEILKKQVATIKLAIVNEQEKADRARAGQNDCKRRMVELDRAFDEEHKRSMDTTEKMMAQYRAMVRERDEKISGLEDELYGKESTLREKERGLRDMIRVKDKELQDREDEIRELRKKIDDMSQKFAAMLKSTLDKMQERIELANTQWDTEVADPLQR